MRSLLIVLAVAAGCSSKAPAPADPPRMALVSRDGRTLAWIDRGEKKDRVVVGDRSLSLDTL